MSNPVVLVNIYAPNFDNVLFANNLLGMIPDLNTHLLVFGGDLNCVTDPALDKSASSSAMAKAFPNFMIQNGYIDPWRFLNPQAKEYYFSFNVHHTYSRFDLFFFINSSMASQISNSEYFPIVISHHVPLVLDITLTPGQKIQPPRRFFASV